MTSATTATSEGAQEFFSKITFLKSVHQAEKNELKLSFVVKIFTKSVHRGGVVSFHLQKCLKSFDKKKTDKIQSPKVLTDKKKAHGRVE